MGETNYLKGSKGAVNVEHTWFHYSPWPPHRDSPTATTSRNTCPQTLLFGTLGVWFTPPKHLYDGFPLLTRTVLCTQILARNRKGCLASAACSVAPWQLSTLAWRRRKEHLHECLLGRSFSALLIIDGKRLYATSAVPAPSRRELVGTTNPPRP